MNYEDMSIYDLRNFARSKGVKSPTSMTKSEIILNIELIDKKIILPIKTKRGRPPKCKELLIEDINIKYKGNRMIISINRIKREMEILEKIVSQVIENFNIK